jgi:hypothetical protein
MYVRAAVFCFVVVGLFLGISLAGNKEVRLKAKGGKERIDPGGTGTVTVTLKNRTRETKEITVTLRYRDIEDAEPIGSATLTLAPKEKASREFDVAVPADWFDRTLRVIASIPDAEKKAKVRTNRSEFTNELWLRGRELYRAECGTRCHGSSGQQVRRQNLTRWITAIRAGPGSMPRYPDLSRADIVLMKEYSKDPKRDVE